MTDRLEIDDLILTLVQLKERFMRAGMFKTSHALEPATQQAGWELAEILEGTHPTKLAEEGNDNEETEENDVKLGSTDSQARASDFGAGEVDWPEAQKFQGRGMSGLARRIRGRLALKSRA